MNTATEANWNKLNENFAVSGQISLEDISSIAAAGYKSIICNRPDGEGGEAQPTSDALKVAAEGAGLQFAYLPVVIGGVNAEKREAFQQLLKTLPEPVFAFCGSGKRATALYVDEESSEKALSSQDTVTDACNWEGGAPETHVIQQHNAEPKSAPVIPACHWDNAFDIVVVGGGSAGIGIAASLLNRRASLRIAIIEPSDKHYYQPAWTLVGGGAFDQADTVCDMAAVIPKGVQWIQAAAAGFLPENNLVQLADGRAISYQQLIVCPGIRLAWEKIEGIEQTLGKNGVTSNYRYDLAPYTWTLVRQLKNGKALFTQPPMPIKCAGAPQKAMYLSCSHWEREGVLDNIEVEFNTATPALFGVAEFVPPLMAYVNRYHANLVFNSNLIKVDGEKKIATFDVKDQNGQVSRVEKPFDMLHVTPPQAAPDFLRNSVLADASGFCEVNPKTLQHARFSNIFSLGDACSSPNAKTAAAARKQIVIVAENLLAAREGLEPKMIYDGYGACPLTVENGKVILAEFGFGGKLLPSFPLDPTVARKSYWWLKARFFPWLYWNAMLKGREWLARSTGTN